MKDYVLRQLKLLAIQYGAMCAGCALWLVLCAFMPTDAMAALYAAYEWALVPLLGGLLIVRLVLRGLQPYFALWALPVCPAVMQLAITGTILSPLALLIYALIGLVCAATGDELRKRRAGSQPGSSKRPR